MAFSLWAENPFHPSLRFKCVNREQDIWSVRISRGYRALGILEHVPGSSPKPPGARGPH